MSESTPALDQRKTCTKCGTSRPLAEYVVSLKPDGKLASWCRDCRLKASRDWYQKNREHHKVLRENWRAQNPGYGKNYYRQNRERLITAAGEYAERNPPDPERRNALARERKAKWKHAGDPCSIVGCGRARKNKTNPLCDAHYKRNLETGLLGGDVRDRKTIARGATCASAGCTEPHHAKGLCRGHYRVLRHRRNPEEGNAATRRRRALRKKLPTERYVLADIIERDGSSCVLCGEQIDIDLPWPQRRSLTVEHLECLSWPGSAGDVLANVSVSHLTCNLARRDRPHPAAARKRAELLAITHS